MRREDFFPRFYWRRGWALFWGICLFTLVEDGWHMNRMPSIPWGYRILQLATPVISALAIGAILTLRREMGIVAYLIALLMVLTQLLFSIACPTWW